VGKGFSGDSVRFQGRFASAVCANLEFAGTTDSLRPVACGGYLDKVDVSHRALFST